MDLPYPIENTQAGHPDYRDVFIWSAEAEKRDCCWPQNKKATEAAFLLENF
jgi:hypothetical protein